MNLPKSKGVHRREGWTGHLVEACGSVVRLPSEDGAFLWTVGSSSREWDPVPITLLLFFRAVLQPLQGTVDAKMCHY